MYPITGENSSFGFEILEDNVPSKQLKNRDQRTGMVTKQTERKKIRVRARKANKLTEDEVRINHVTSEKKRRENVRSIYDDLVKLVPDLEQNENRSELIIYLKTTYYLRWLYKKNNQLRTKLKEFKDDAYESEAYSQELVWEINQGEK
ncbi:Ino4p NDAI_0G04100 [Naumovozyma dairenensis CBS 421]|uniref:BHLH domain-containing protein n=1 Tax=Naumovozyma dairenensis (strain ATCC 10597 / BCRC 20456 / CBS 421 / NBRC 0211 / NRRL Y-12639) TaxID=1071378 RepID=J7SBL9_NAUDC|nr:hypothetical protein NDAI_0G04100 [Naumovozyma dairenensis CBS 421]CCK73395.1 hypothetical protein NDAI_0G04100 [Naumovozyma dairenensis CBS 421]